MAALGTLSIIGRPLNRGAGTAAESALADNLLLRAEKQASRDNGGGPSTASAQPPLYYALLTIPYRLTSWASLPVRLEAMRLVSVLIFAFGAAFSTLFVRELLPRYPQAALAGGVAIALSPYTAFISSGVNPDALLLTVSTALLLVLVRASRRGLDTPHAAAIGLLIGAGLLTKLTFLAFVGPGMAAFALLIFREWRRRLAIPWRRMAWFAGALLVLPALTLAWLAITGREVRPSGTSTPPLAVGAVTASNSRELVSYAWQLFLPPLPLMDKQFPFSALREIWISGYAGRYGWLDYSAPASVNNAAVRVVSVVGVLTSLLIVKKRKSIRRRWVECVVGCFFVCSLWAIIAKAGYDYRRVTGATFEQPRYLFPIAAFWALLVGSACASLGRRIAPYSATVLIAIFCLHNLTGFALTIARYYG